MAASLDVVWARSLSGADGDDYDRFVHEAAGGHYAQSRAYVQVARASRPARVRYFLAREAGKTVGAALILRSAVGPLPLPAAHVARGPVVAQPADLARVARALAEAARARGVLRLSVMPYWADEEARLATTALRSGGYHDVQRHDGAHAVTARIDLREPADRLLHAPGQQSLRHRVSQAERAGATARRGEPEDFATHARLETERQETQGKRPRPAALEALGAYVFADPCRGALFVGEHEGEVVSSVVVLCHRDVAVYAQGATSPTPKRFGKSVLPLLAAVAWSRQAGCAVFDLGGLPEEIDADEKRRAIAHLKLDFAPSRLSLVREHARWL